jgi:hypothetical protein
MRVSVQAPLQLILLLQTQVTPVFTAIGPLCVGATAPPLLTLSNNGITVHGTRLRSALLLPVLLPTHLLLMQVSVLRRLLRLM